jgi:cytochrome c-type biogenesis protein CcmF
MYPEQRFYKASQQPQTMVANRSTPREDLYLVFAGTNPDTGKPIIKAHVNPLVWWIWGGLHLWVIGIIIALLPNAAPPKLKPAPQQSAAHIADKAEAGTPVGAGD